MTHVPFSSERKMETIVVVHPEQESKVRVIVKGAPEFIFEKCTEMFDTEG